MKIKQTFILLFGGIIIMMLVIAATIGFLVQNRSDLINSQEIRYKSYAIANELKQSSDDLTRFCRTFVMTGDTSWETKYWNVIKIRNGEMPRPDGRKIALLDSMKALGFIPEELKLLKKAEIYSNKLVWTEKVAFNALHGKFADKDSNFTISAPADTNYARKIMFDNNYLEAKNKIMKPINDFLAPIDQRTYELVQYHKKEGWVILGSALIVILLVNLASFIAYFLVRKKLNEQLRAEAALLKSEMKYRELVENLNDVIFTTNTVGIITYVSPQVQQLYGYSPQELIGHPFSEIIHPEDRQKVESDFLATLENKIEIREFRFINKEGRIKWAQTTSRPIIEEGRKIGINGIFSDIDERKQAELKVLESEKRFKAIIEQSPIAIALLDMGGHPIVSNAALSRMVGYSSDELSQMTFAEFTYPEDAEKDMNQFIALLEGKISGYSMEKRYVHKNGNLVWGNLYVSIRRDINGLPEEIIGMAADITDRKKAEEQLYVYKHSLDNAPFAAYWIDQHGEFTYFNDMSCKMLGYTREEMMKQSIFTIASGMTVERWETTWQQAKKEIYFYNTHSSHQQKDGSILPVEIFSVYMDYQGIEYLNGFAIDITQRLKAQAALDETHEFNETLLKAIPFGMKIVDESGTILFMNEQFTETYGEEALGKNCSDVFHFNNEVCNDCKLKRGINEGITELHGSHGIMTDRTYLVNHIPMNFRGKKAILEIFHDITERKQAEVEIIKAKDKAENSEKQIQQIANNLASGMIYQVVLLDEFNRKFTYISDSVKRFFGCTVDEALADANLIYSKTHPDDIDLLMEEERKALKNMSVFQFTMRIFNPEGKILWLSLTSSPRLMNGLIYWDGIVIDITNLKQIERELISAKDKAEESDSLKSAFLANMSHEIRTPLNSIIGFSELLLDPFFEEEQQVEFVQTIKSNGNNLLDIISNIMDISKIESGQMTFRKQQFSVTKLIQEIQKEQLHLIKDKNLEIRIQIPDHDINLESDQGRVKQILMNFVNNSIKFTEKGYVEIGCNLISGSVQFYVKDTGIGIPVEYHEKIFERFRQVESAHTRKYGGNGLGLTIAKQLADLMGSKVSMESEPGIGSTFYFSIPSTIPGSVVPGTLDKEV